MLGLDGMSIYFLRCIPPSLGMERGKELTTSQIQKLCQFQMYERIMIKPTPMTTPRIIESRRRLDFIMDTRLLIPGMVFMTCSIRP